METTDKTIVSVQAEFNTALFKAGFSGVLNTVLHLPPNLLGLARSKAEPR